MYDLQNEIIHDQKAMWHLALSFKCRYNFLKEQINKAKKDNYLLHNGNLLFKHRDEKLFQKIVKEYKNDFAAIERVIEQDIRLNSSNEKHYVKYVDSF